MGDTSRKQIDQRYQEPCRDFELTRTLPPGGVTKARVAHVPGRHAIYMDRARGAHVRNVDENEYFDWMSGCGCILLGHRRDAACGAYFRPNYHWFVDLSHTPEDVARTLEACEAALELAEESIDCRV